MPDNLVNDSIKEIDATDLIKQMQDSLDTKLDIIPRGEIQDWYWELCLSPTALEPAYLQQDQVNRTWSSVKAKSEEHELLFSLAHVSGYLMPKLHSYQYEQEQQKLYLDFETKWADQELNDIDTFLIESDASPVERVAELFNDPIACVSIRTMYDNCFHIVRFYDLSVDAIQNNNEDKNYQTICISCGAVEEETFARAPDHTVVDLVIPTLIIDGTRALRFDTGIYAFSIAYSSQEDRDEIISTALESELSPDYEQEEPEDGDQAKPVTEAYKKKRKNKNKLAKKQRKQARKKK